MLSQTFRPSLASLTLVAFLSSCLFGQSPAAAAESSLRSDLKKNIYNVVDELSEPKAAEYVMRRYPGEKLMAVRILSGVRAPGIYYVPEGTDLLTAISLAGGLVPTADPERIHWNNFSANKYKMLDIQDSVEDPRTRNPVLGANDLLMVDETKPVISTNTVLVVTVIASLIGIAIGAKALSK
jgi:hypothetical protein